MHAVSEMLTIQFVMLQARSQHDDNLHVIYVTFSTSMVCSALDFALYDRLLLIAWHESTLSRSLHDFKTIRHSMS